jgi:hypothetical protein
MTKQALDDPKRMLDFGADAGLDLFQLLLECVDWVALVHSIALARHHGNYQVYFRALRLHFFTLVNTPVVTRVGKDRFLLAMQHCSRLRDLMGVGCSGVECVH